MQRKGRMKNTLHTNTSKWILKNTTKVTPKNIKIVLKIDNDKDNVKLEITIASNPDMINVEVELLLEIHKIA